MGTRTVFVSLVAGWRAPLGVAVMATAVLALWLWAPWRSVLHARVPAADRRAGIVVGAAEARAFESGVTERGPGQAAQLKGSWPSFRGGLRDGRWAGETALAKSWGAGVPRTLWEQPVGEGFAGPAMEAGRLYLMDYDRERGRDALRCLSMEDGREIWRFSYPMPLKRNHGLSRTVPALARGRVVAMGPKAHVVCVDAESGIFRWGLDLAKDFGATVPPWYAGQCPLIDGDSVILAPGGDQIAMMAVALETGEVRWKATHEAGWKMSHASIAVLEVEGVRYYVYPASGGVLVVRAADGVVAWASDQWKINIATVPTPVVCGPGRVFFTGGYNAGSAMFEFRAENASLVAREVFRLKSSEFGATQHSPVWDGKNFYGIRADGRLVSLSAEGQVLWTSGEDTSHGLGPLMLAGDVVLALAEGGRLSMVAAEPAEYRLLGTHEVMEGHECWAPMALADGRLLVRDLTRLVCLDLTSGKGP